MPLSFYQGNPEITPFKTTLTPNQDLDDEIFDSSKDVDNSEPDLDIREEMVDNRSSLKERNNANWEEMRENIRLLRLLSEVEKAVPIPKQNKFVPQKVQFESHENVLVPSKSSVESSFLSPPGLIPSDSQSSRKLSTKSIDGKKLNRQESLKFNTKIFSKSPETHNHNSRKLSVGENRSSFELEDYKEAIPQRWDHLAQLERKAREASIEGLRKASLVSSGSASGGEINSQNHSRKLLFLNSTKRRPSLPFTNLDKNHVANINRFENSKFNYSSSNKIYPERNNDFNINEQRPRIVVTNLIGPDQTSQLIDFSHRSPSALNKNFSSSREFLGKPFGPRPMSRSISGSSNQYAMAPSGTLSSSARSFTENSFSENHSTTSAGSGNGLKPIPLEILENLLNTSNHLIRRNSKFDRSLLQPQLNYEDNQISLEKEEKSKEANFNRDKQALPINNDEIERTQSVEVQSTNYSQESFLDGMEDFLNNENDNITRRDQIDLNQIPLNRLPDQEPEVFSEKSSRDVLSLRNKAKDLDYRPIKKVNCVSSINSESHIFKTMDGKRFNSNQPHPIEYSSQLNSYSRIPLTGTNPKNHEKGTENKAKIDPRKYYLKSKSSPNLVQRSNHGNSCNKLLLGVDDHRRINFDHSRNNQILRNRDQDHHDLYSNRSLSDVSSSTYSKQSQSSLNKIIFKFPLPSNRKILVRPKESFTTGKKLELDGYKNNNQEDSGKDEDNYGGHEIDFIKECEEEERELFDDNEMFSLGIKAFKSEPNLQKSSFHKDNPKPTTLYSDQNHEKQRSKHTNWLFGFKNKNKNNDGHHDLIRNNEIIKKESSSSLGFFKRKSFDGGKAGKRKKSLLKKKRKVQKIQNIKIKNQKIFVKE
ncbi:expressed protein [Phakopsora pachyrhizi]|uniref:Expressed protein n=1 Tax=Phakopsora pachyrhizi TaxID=170000 RepID=A0AAV0AM51_PHAPC|nr:expressed protein [Phakopsora pachyrhizi]